MPVAVPHVFSRLLGRVHDRLAFFLVTAGIVVSGSAAILRGAQMRSSLHETVPPFLILAAMLVVAGVAARFGVFSALTSRLLRLTRGSRLGALALAMVWTAALSGLTNLDVAVVFGMPLALEISGRHRVDAAWMTAAVAISANASSILFPTSNLTTLLVLGRSQLGAGGFVAHAWVAWTLVTVGTVAIAVTLVARRPVHISATTPVEGTPQWRARNVAVDLGAMFLIAAGVRAWLAGGIHVGGTAAEAAAVTGALAALVNNLPAAAAVIPRQVPAAWGSVIGLAIGPNLLLTGSVATVICRRIARESGADLPIRTFAALGLAIAPIQFVLALVGLRLTGAI